MCALDIESIISRITALIQARYGNQHGYIKKFSIDAKVNYETLVRILTDKDKLPKAEFLLRIAEFCEVSLEYILKGIDPPPQEKSGLPSLIKKIDPSYNENDQSILDYISQNFDTLSRDDQRKLRHVVDALMIQAQEVHDKTASYSKKKQQPSMIMLTVEEPLSESDQKDFNTLKKYHSVPPRKKTR